MLTLASALLILQVTLDARSMTAGLPLPAIISEVRELWQPYLDVVFRTAADPVTACDGRVAAAHHRPGRCGSRDAKRRHVTRLD